MTASVKIERLLKKCFHEEQQKLILIIEVAERYVYMKSSKRRRPTSWCTGGHGARQERSQFCFHSQPSVPPCLPPSFLSLPSSSQPSDSSCLSPSSPPQQTSSVSYSLASSSPIWQPSSVCSCLSPTSPPLPYPFLDPFYFVNLQPPRHHQLRLIWNLKSSDFAPSEKYS